MREPVAREMRLRLLQPCSFSRAALAPAGGAQASVSWVVHGHGFGHGVGMSQYGAYGYAQHGKGYRFILAHYYQGTLDRDPDRGRGSSASCSASRAATSASAPRPAPAASPSTPPAPTQAHRDGTRVKLRSSAGKPLADCGRKLRAAGDGQDRDRRRRHLPRRARGRCRPNATPARSTRSTRSPVDQYVKGVIPNESPPSWPQAALQAQAVASRSFALTAGVGGNGFDLYDDTRSQVYDGLDSETAATNAAAEATRGQVVTYGGKIAETYFSACSGGHTESIQNVFGGPAIPYLVGVPDPYDCYCPLHDWTLQIQRPGNQRQARRLPRRQA